jgi:hypothetical protein
MATEPKRQFAGLVPQSRGLSQQTGAGSQSQVAEATKLMGMINPVRKGNPEAIRGEDRAFLADMQDKMNNYGSGLFVSGKQLFRLREIKDRLVEEGEI